MATKLKDEGTSISTVRDQFLSFSMIPNPLISHNPLPLMDFFFTVVANCASSFYIRKY